MEEVLLHVVPKEDESFGKLRVTDAKLTIVIHPLNQKIAIFSDETRVSLASYNLCELVENKVLLKQARSILVDLTQLNGLSLLDPSQVELVGRINPHPLAPDIGLLAVIEGYAVVETACQVDDPLLRRAELDLSWLEDHTNDAILKSKLPEDIPPPGEDFTLSGQQASKKVSTDDLCYRELEVDAKRYRRYVLKEFLALFLIEDLPLTFLVLGYCGQPAIDNSLIPSLRVYDQEYGRGIPGGNLHNRLLREGGLSDRLLHGKLGVGGDILHHMLI
jgi:hypothetical protein